MDKKKSQIPIEIYAAAGTISGLLTLGTVAFHLLEKWSWINSFYFSVVTLATVGYGDLTPKSAFGRLFTSFYILFGTAAALAALGTIGARYLERRGIKMSQKRER